ncbi:MAG: ABC transporter substrate-binding protein, partial [Micromonosporaceae bacterium]|nr:ABC transporter substrate-binding protein [Micromonosporaceae bacterium]
AVAGLLAMVLASSTAACSAGTEGSGSSTIKVGLILPLTGTYQSLSGDFRDGFQLYLDTHGGKLGGHRVTVITVDEGEGPTTAVPSANKLIKQDRVDVVSGIVAGGTAAAVIPLMTQARIPVIGVSARPELKDVSMVWHTSYLSDEPGAAIAQYVKDNVKGTVFAIGPDYQGGWDQLRGFTDTFAKAGGQLANKDGKTTFTPFPTTTNFTPYFTQIKASKAAAVYCFYAGTAAIEFVKQYAQSDLRDLPLYASGILTEGSVLAAQGDAAKDIYSVFNYSSDLDNPANRTFVSGWRAKHPSPPTSYAMSSFDAAIIMDRAIAAAGENPTPEQINAEIAKLGKIDSPRGPWQLSKKTHSPIQKWYLRQVRLDGQTLANVVVEDLVTIGS